MARWRSCRGVVKEGRSERLLLPKWLFLFVFNSVHVFLTSFIISRVVFSKTPSRYMNLKSSSKYQSCSRNVDLRETSKRNQVQTKTKDTADAENHKGQDSDSQCMGAAPSQCVWRVTEPPRFCYAGFPAHIPASAEPSSCRMCAFRYQACQLRV